MELTLKYTELIMLGIIMIQIIMLITVSLNQKILKNALQKENTPKKIKQKSKTPLREVPIRNKTPLRNSPNQAKKENQPIQGRNKIITKFED